VSQQLSAATRALDSLVAVSKLDVGSIERRDIAIMRFIYTFEAVWKASLFFLAEEHAIDASSPKSCIRASMQVGLLSPDEARAALEMANDRNLTVHVYNEPLAEALYARLPRHTEVLGAWLKAMNARIAKAR
jgi:nucleotidyltransferase substrate binding protein (TIGR01987 family)